MKKIYTAFAFFFLSLAVCSGQAIGFTENFNDNIKTGWSGDAVYTLTETNQELQVVDANSSNYKNFVFTLPARLDLTNNPYVKLSIKSASTVSVRLDLVDTLNWVTNKTAVVQTVSGGAAYTVFTYDFTGLFYQQYSATNTGQHVVDQSAINKITITFNAGSNFSGTVYLDDLLIGSATGIQSPPPNIRLNQVGFYPHGPKVAIAVDAVGGPFYIVSSDQLDTVFTGNLGNAASWSYSGETVRKADFSAFDSTGRFYVLVPGLGYSHPFAVKPSVHHEASKASIKGFYYQRASTALPATYAGLWARAAGHPDNVVSIHNSAGSPCRDPAVAKINGSRGWYDAGDYNKYVVNAGISTYSLMAMYERYSTYFDTLNTNIPESGNNIPDILDEVLWEIRWLLTMQDPCDGGIYTKLTSPDFGATTMPAADLQPRYVVQKSTAASLDFAATLAQAARVFSRYPTELPGLADSCIYYALGAWRWARSHPNVAYIQANLSNPTINTGAYGDASFSDELRWAAAELYTTTKLDSFYTAMGGYGNLSVPYWGDVKTLATYTLSHYKKHLTPLADTTGIKSVIQSFANSFSYQTGISAYGVAMGTNGIYDFNWGSNGQAANQGMALMAAFDQTKDSTYLDAAIANLDYILGRNGTNYSFLTGYGNLSPKNIHHSPSYKDGIVEPVPGLLAGGPNTDQLSDCGATSYPSSTLKAKAYRDNYCSYSTNEIAINWNAPFAYLSNCIEAVQANISSSVISFPPFIIYEELITGKMKVFPTQINLKVHPIPATTEFKIEFEGSGTSLVSLVDMSGKKIYEISISQDALISSVINIEHLAKGMYVLIVKNDLGSAKKKVIVQ